ncbi:aldehyde dehydrogenase (NADP(+)) [Malonomonas rubra]|uniref:aldehyde dehydrogenase (NADP(+)) n=1 Tax=Malonomonas rubra TaxID=57040 RepID=UPI0026EF4035|nr:aldehyde dehydrogenase (NADP(+)) [Malonomonas rubra]
MTLTGGSIVAAALSQGTGKYFWANDPATDEQLQPAFFEASEVQINDAVEAAENDFDRYRRLPFAQRADFLTAIAEQLRIIEGDVIVRAQRETALSLPRLQGELTRTVNQLLMFAAYVRDGSFLHCNIDPALPERQPPRPDLRMTQVPLGPVVVFGASNFPFAFSVAGGDTAAALAAGCPVIFKGHPAHPGTCELAGRAIARAVELCGVPQGVFSMLQGERHELGAELIKHRLVRAVAFTGSRIAGRALFDLAASRPEPIPVFAEMGSVNPVFLLPAALAAWKTELACQYAESVTLGVGQFCTNPGMLFAVAGPDLQAFTAAVQTRLEQLGGGVMLHAGIKRNYQTAFDILSERPGVEILSGPGEQAGCRVSPALLKTTAESFLSDPGIAEEVFGPSAIVVACRSMEQMSACAGALQGQLTATVHASDTEEDIARQLFSILERKAGRLLLNGFPTGVEVCSAMIHGGPYPATTDSRTTSVGTEALQRFLRPICLQNFSSGLLPGELQ